MSQLLILLIASFAVLNVQSRVIKLEEFPIKDDLTLKIYIHKDKEGNPVAGIKVIEKPPMDRLIDKFVKPALGVIPSFNDRSFIGGAGCPSGQVRRGFVCVPA